MKRIKDSKGFGSTGLTASRIEAWRKQTARQIQEHGRAVVAVMSDADKGKPTDEVTPDFAYTLGNCLQEEPFAEVWSCYPSQPTMRFVLNHISEAIRDGELEVTAEPVEVPGFLGQDGELPVRLRLMTSLERVVAYERYTCQLPSPSVPVVIAEMPDPRGFFADDDRCHPGVRDVMLQAPFRVAAPEAN